MTKISPDRNLKTFANPFLALLIWVAVRGCVQRSLHRGGEGGFWLCNDLQRGGRGSLEFATTTLLS